MHASTYAYTDTHAYTYTYTHAHEHDPPPSPSRQDRGISARHNKFGTLHVKIEQKTERASIRTQHGKRSPRKKAAVTKFKGAHLLKWLSACCVLNCVGAAAVSSPAAAQSPTPVISVGTAADFCLLTKAGITSTGATSVDGNIGTSPIAATAITGFALQYASDSTSATSSLVSGRVYAADFATTTPAKMTAAISDMEAAYVDAAGRPNPDTVERGAGLIGGITLTGGVHKWSTVVTVPVGQKLYFDARGDNDT
eukprot:scaffold32175_cov64-Phaeocystis_antarctica.AAC.1